MKMVVATNNQGKVKELRALLPAGISLLSLQDVHFESPHESGASFVDNASLKARCAAKSGFPAIADDSGLEIDALRGAPGVYSARYAGPDATDERNNRLVLEQLKDVPHDQRRARFVSAVAIVTPEGSEYTAIGTLEGIIVDVPRGSGGFGYDPIFQIADDAAGELNGRTLAEISPEEKNRISHRARAYAALSRAIGEMLSAHDHRQFEG